MPDFDVDLDGSLDLREALQDRAADLQTTSEWVTGTAVEYAVYLEFGTRNMDPRPFVRPALAAYRSNLDGAIRADTQTSLDTIDDADRLVQTVAFGLERRIKRIITQKGLIDTGTLRASVQAVPAARAGDLPEADEVDPDDVAASRVIDIEP